MRVYNHLLLVKCISFAYFLVVMKSCQPPDVPVSGFYHPIQTRYLPGDKVVYSCEKGFMRIGRETRFCEFNGKWSEYTPFCDTPTKMKNPVPSLSNPLSSANEAVDGEPSTCFYSRKGTGQSLKVYFEEPAVVNVIRILFPIGKVKVEIYTVRKGVKKKCCYYDRELEEPEWVLLDCEDNVSADSIHIQDISATQNVLKICEIEIYVKDGVWCSNSPEIYVPNGWLTISREKATLHCAEGYREGENVRLVCDKSDKWSGGNLQCEEILCERLMSNFSDTGGEWHVTGKSSKISAGSVKKLRCNQGFRMTGEPDSVTCLINGTWTKSAAACVEMKSEKEALFRKTIIIVSVIIVLIILGCFVLIFLVLKKRSKPVVVVLKADQNGYAMQSCSGSGTSAYSEAEYSTIAYDAINNLPQHPTLPAKSVPPANLLLDSYSKPTDQWTLGLTKIGDDAHSYANPQGTLLIRGEATPATDIVFGTLKSSDLYGS